MAVPRLEWGIFDVLWAAILVSRNPEKADSRKGCRLSTLRPIPGGFMCRRAIILLSAILLTFLFSSMAANIVSAAQDETIVGTVVKHGKDFVLEADEGDYTLKGKDLTKMLGKLVEVTGTIVEGEKGDTIQVKSVEEIQE